MKAIICDRCKSINGYKAITYVRVNKMVSIWSYVNILDTKSQTFFMLHF